MASTYSPTLRIELIGDGDQSGIWGQTTNNNLGALLEQAITGVVTIVMTDANYTLTNYNGVVDEARNAVIIATGTNSAQRNIVAPLVEKIYTIKNSTVGGYAIQVIGSSGTGVVIPNGVTTSVYCDGTNFYNLQVGTTGNETINGNLLVTGTTTLQGALTATTAAFSGAISSVSPTFTGTPLSPTAPNGTSTTQIATTAFVANTVTALGLGTMATQNANNVAITGGTISGITISSLAAPLAVLYGGTGSSTASGARTNLGLAIGTDIPSPTGTGASGTWNINVTGSSATTSQTNFSNLTIGSSQVLYAGNYNSYAPTLTGTGASGTWGINITGVTTNTASNGYGTRTVSGSAPSGGSNGDIWYQV